MSFQTWVWKDDNYQLTQYIIDDGETLQVSKFACEYRAVRRAELTNLLLSNGCSDVVWQFPEETGFYQPVVVARKKYNFLFSFGEECAIIITNNCSIKIERGGCFGK